MQKKLLQVIYGSTKWSAGYSILAKSENVEERLTDKIIEYCENYDQKLVSTPYFGHSVSIYSIDKYRILLEIFDGWTDQVGRASKIMRNVIIEESDLEFINNNPFIVLWLLPEIKKNIPKKRDEIKLLPDIDFIDKKDWQLLWNQETQVFLKNFKKLTNEEKNIVFYAKNISFDNSDKLIEIPTEHDKFNLCRTIFYALKKDFRKNISIDSFCLNNYKKSEGICFREKRYFVYNLLKIPNMSNLDTLEWKIETIIDSIPKNVAPFVFKKIFVKNILFYKIIACTSFMFFLFLLAIVIRFILFSCKTN